MIHIIELILSIGLMILDLVTGIYVIQYLYSMPGNKKLERRLEEKRSGKKVILISLILIFFNFIYFIFY